MSRGTGGRRGERARHGLGWSKSSARRRMAHYTHRAQELGFSSVSVSKPLKAACTSLKKLSYLSAHLQLNLCFPVSSVKKENRELLGLLRCRF